MQTPIRGPFAAPFHVYEVVLEVEDQAPTDSGFEATKHQWSVWRRFSDFADLYGSLKGSEKFDGLLPRGLRDGLTIPTAIPGYTLFGAHFADEIAYKRAQGLQSGLLIPLLEFATVDFWRHLQIDEFFQISKNTSGRERAANVDLFNASEWKEKAGKIKEMLELLKSQVNRQRLAQLSEPKNPRGGMAGPPARSPMGKVIAKEHIQRLCIDVQTKINGLGEQKRQAPVANQAECQRELDGLVNSLAALTNELVWDKEGRGSPGPRKPSIETLPSTRNRTPDRNRGTTVGAKVKATSTGPKALPTVLGPQANKADRGDHECDSQGLDKGATRAWRQAGKVVR